MLLHANMLTLHWVDCLYMKVFIINRAPSSVLQFHSSFCCMFGFDHDLSLLKKFGCVCYPYLGSCISNNLSHISKACVFIGYAVKRKGYRCLDCVIRWVVISCHVVFDESMFPFVDSYQIQSTCSSYDQSPILISIHLNTSSSTIHPTIVWIAPIVLPNYHLNLHPLLFNSKIPPKRINPLMLFSCPTLSILNKFQLKNLTRLRLPCLWQQYLMALLHSTLILCKLVPSLVCTNLTLFLIFLILLSKLNLHVSLKLSQILNGKSLRLRSIILSSQIEHGILSLLTLLKTWSKMGVQGERKFWRVNQVL